MTTADQTMTGAAIIERVQRHAASVREASADVRTYARTGADAHDRDIVESYIATADRHVDTTAALAYYAETWLIVAEHSSVDETRQRLHHRAEACAVIAEALDEAAMALRHWAMKRFGTTPQPDGEV